MYRWFVDAFLSCYQFQDAFLHVSNAAAKTRKTFWPLRGRFSAVNCQCGPVTCWNHSSFHLKCNREISTFTFTAAMEMRFICLFKIQLRASIELFFAKTSYFMTSRWHMTLCKAPNHHQQPYSSYCMLQPSLCTVRFILLCALRTSLRQWIR